VGDGYERLSAQDTLFLHIEGPDQPQHVGALGLFEAAPFLDESGVVRLDDIRRRIEARLDRVPRFRKRLMHVPLQQGRPVWVDDDRFDLSYHVRLTALPSPGDEEQLLALMGRIQSLHLDRRRPLWELWFVDGVSDDRIALIQKTHHCLVDGISGVDVATVLFDLAPDAADEEPAPWSPAPPPSPARLVAESIAERATEPAELARSARAAMRRPRQALSNVAEIGRAALVATQTAPQAPWNVPIGPHRRFRPGRVPLATARRIKEASGTTINDVVLAAVSAGLREFLLAREEPVEGLVLKAMVPVSVRSDEEHLVLGNRVSTVVADLPVGEADPRRRLVLVHENMRAMKESGLAMAADAIIRIQDYAPPTLVGAASRLIVRSHAVNLAITNVPGPQFPLYCMGARLLEAFPYVPIVRDMALTVAVVSYDGQLGFGITGDRDVLPDIDVVARGIERGFTELDEALAPAPARRKRSSRTRSS
jgi:diacylglycerol O-acyltransferase / wax synthase